MWPHTTNADDTHYNLIFPCENNQHPLNCTTDASGNLALKGNQGGQESMEWGRGASPPAGPGPSGTPVLFLSLLLSRCPREKCYTDGKITVGSFESDFFLKKAELYIAVFALCGEQQSAWFADLLVW